VNIQAIDQLLARLQMVGRAGALPKNANLPQLIDELQRQLGILGDAARALLSELRQGPRFPKDGLLFVVDCRTATTNLLSTAQAAAEGLGAIAGLAIYRHGLGLRLNRAAQPFASNIPTVGVVNGQASRNGTCFLYGWDDNRTVFQVDQDAQSNQSVFIVSCYPSRVQPSTITNPGAAQKTGAAAPQLGFELASSPLAEFP